MTSFTLPQKVTYWTPSGVDANGDPSWTVGVAVDARWARKDGIVTGENGTDQKFEYIIYSETLIPKRSMVVLDDQDGVATPPNDARVILSTVDIPSYTTLAKMVL